MATVIDELVAKLRLDPSGFKVGSDQAQIYLQQTKKEATRTAESMEAGGKQAAAFFSQIKNEALGLIAVLIGAKGLEDFVKGTTTSLANLGREARNIGVSAQALAAFSMVIERNGGSAESARQSLFGLSQQIENFKVFGDPHILRFLYPIGASISDSPLAIFMKFMEFAQQHANDPRLINLIGHGLGFDQGTINAAEQLKTLTEYQKEYNKALRDAPTEGQVKAATELQSQWYALEQTGQALGRAILQILDPALIAAAKNMQKWLEVNKNWLADDITGKVHDLGTDIAYAGKQMDNWKSAAELLATYFAGPFVIAMMAGLGPVGAAIVAIVAGLALIDKSIKGTSLADLPVGSPLWQRVSAEEQGNYANSPRSQAFLRSVGMAGNPNPYHWWNPGSWLGRAPAMNTAQQQLNEDAIRRYFLAQGYTPAQVAGILSNVAAESSFNPQAENAGHYGLFQWDATRQAQFLALFGHPIQKSTLQEQLEFAQWELTHTYGVVGRMLRREKTPIQSGMIISRGYEVAPGGFNTDLYRGEMAQQYMPPAGSAAPPSSVSPAITGSTTTINVNGPITVNTKATDAKGVAKGLTRAIVTQANRGLTP